MQLGNFSVSLAVKDIEASRQFYEKLGSSSTMGEATTCWLIMKERADRYWSVPGMFEKSMLTFNPGWDGNAQPVETFTDIRELQRRLKADGVALITEADASTTGPASFIVVDPDGNPILVDQHR